MKSIFDRIVFLLAGIALILAGVALVDFLLHPLAGDRTFDSTLFRAVMTLVLIPLNLLSGFLIIRRVPGNIVGPLLVVWTGTVAYMGVRDEMAPWLFALYYWFDMAFGWLALFLVLLHFPYGTLYPPRLSRWLYPNLLLVVASMQLVFLSQSLLVTSQMANPFHLSTLVPYERPLEVFVLLWFVPIVTLAFVSPALHYLKGSYRERQQIKWLAFFGAAFVIYTIFGLIALPLLTGKEVMDPGSGPFALFFYFSVALLPPVTIGNAVLRHHLWDIDVIIRRTLIYSTVTGVLALVYYSSIVLLQQFLPAESQLGIVVSTLIIAALFNPLRNRIQQVIERRFYRRKYDAQEVLARFAQTARDEVELETLRSELVNVVQKTMQPAQITVWLRDS